MAAVRLCALASLVLAGSAVGPASTSQMQVEVEWELYMRCGACRAYAHELSHMMNASFERPAGTFPMEEMRRDWIMHEAQRETTEGYVYVTHDTSRFDEQRGLFMRTEQLMALNEGNQEALDGLRDQQEAPMPSLVSYVSHIADAHEDTINGLIREHAGVERIFGEVCRKSVDDLSAPCPGRQHDDEL